MLYVTNDSTEFDAMQAMFGNDELPTHREIQRTFVASAIVSEIQSSDIYLTVKARICDLKANLNGVKVTDRFISEIVANEDKYIGIPLCADVRGLLSNKTIGHMYDAQSGEFHSTIIGSFYHFEKQVTSDNTYLVGYARIMKRNKAVCEAITRLFANNELKFSFEISCGEYKEDTEGFIVIDYSPKNFLEGTAVVTFPACTQAVALDLVAECLSKGDDSMTENENVIVETETTEIAETTETVETVAEETTEVAESTENAESTEVAETEVTETEETEETTETTETEETAAVVEEDNEQEDTKDEPMDEQNAACKKEENAETFSMSELLSTIEALRHEIAEIKSAIATKETTVAEETTEHPTDVVAEATENTEVEETIDIRASLLMNPFMAEMKSPVRHTLLDREEKKTNYSLLDRA